MIHDSHDPLFRRPFGALPTCGKLTLSIWVSVAFPAEQIRVRIFQDGEKEGEEYPLLLVEEGLPRETLRWGKNPIPIGPFFIASRHVEGGNEGNVLGRLYQTEIPLPSEPGLLWYYFLLQDGDRCYYYGNNTRGQGGIGELTAMEPLPYQITLYEQGFKTPSWFKQGIVYQIFVDRFFNGNEDGRILHPKRNALLHAHWEDDPLYIRDERGHVIRWNFFGGNLLGVLKKLPYLKQLGITAIYFNPIFESSSNHKYDTGDYHKIDPMYGDESLFQTLCQAAEKEGIRIILDGVFNHTGSDSKYFNKEGNYPTLGAYQSPRSPYYSWYRFSQYPDHYDSWWGIENMPSVNELEPSYLHFIIDGEDSVLRHWSRAGIKGWRFDVADELPDLFIEHFREVQKEVDPEAVLIGEVWEDASNKVSYGKRRKYLSGRQFDSIMNYPLREIMIHFMLGKKSGEDTHRAIMSLYENYPREHFFSLLNMLSTHDTPRILTVMKEEIPSQYEEDIRYEIASRRLRLLIMWQMTFPGVPHIFYGDEAGLEGKQDPDNRRTYPWGRENQEMMEWYKKMIRLRQSLPPLFEGDWHSLSLGEDLYGYNWNFKGYPQSLLVVLNRSLSQEEQISILPSHPRPLMVINLLTGERFTLEEGDLTLTLSPLEGKLLLFQWK